MNTTDMRVQITRRMLREGLLRCIDRKPLSKITVSELCRESGVNRATFYNHYDSPAMIFKAIAEEYADNLRTIYRSHKEAYTHTEEPAILACLEYLYERKEEIKILLSGNAENSISGFGLEIIQTRLERHKDLIKQTNPDSYEDLYLSSVLTASAAYGLIQIWLVGDYDKTPREIADLLKRTFGRKYFS